MNTILLLPAETSPLVALALIVFSFLTSAISAAFGLGGGVAMLIALLSLTPPIVALPVHALVQIGSNAGRAWMLRPHVMSSVVKWFIPGSILGFVLTQWLFLVAAMIASGLLGTWMGRGLLQRLPEQAFRQIFKAVLTVLAVRLLYKALAP